LKTPESFMADTEKIKAWMSVKRKKRYSLRIISRHLPDLSDSLLGRYRQHIGIFKMVAFVLPTDRKLAMGRTG